MQLSQKKMKINSNNEKLIKTQFDLIQWNPSINLKLINFNAIKSEKNSKIQIKSNNELNST